MANEDRLHGAAVHDASGAAVGTVGALLVDPVGHEARWLEVTLIGGGRAVVPVQAAAVDAEGRLAVPYSLDDLRAAPTADDGVVSADLAASLLRHYGFPPDAP